MSRQQMLDAIKARQAATAQAEAKQEKAAEKPKQQATTPPGAQPKKAKKPKKDFRMTMEFLERGRLPHGSRFESTWDSETARWTGTLTLLSGQVFSEDSSAVMKLLRKLDVKYRAWLKETRPTTEVTDEPVQPA